MVSIHAPARGATRRCFLLQPADWFQSTRPRGARLCFGGFCGLFRRFNPRARAGRDWEIHSSSDDLAVSIHAPARGATVNSAMLMRSPKFQSTRPRGARPGVLPGQVFPAGFNPRARAGRDVCSSSTSLSSGVSIHAPARGATSPGYNSSVGF